MNSDTKGCLPREEKLCDVSQHRTCRSRKSKLFPVRLSEFLNEVEEARVEPLDLGQPDDIILENVPDSPKLQASDDKENCKASKVNCTDSRPYLNSHSFDNGDLAVIPEESERLCGDSLQFKNKTVFRKYPESTPKKTTKPLSEKANTICKSKHITSSRVVPLSIPKNQLGGVQHITVKQTSYIVWNEIGRGGSSVVYHCFEPLSKEQKAIKCVSLQNTSSASGYINEVKLLQRLQKCSNIIKMFDYELLETQKTLYVVLELGSCDLHEVLKELSINRRHLPLYKLMYYWMEMLHAVQEIHDNGIIHSDLKPANFIQVKGSVKLIDFGIARTIQSDMTSVIKDVPEGSFSYISPEALRNDASGHTKSPSSAPVYKISFKSDVWSLGCILYQFVYKRTPFQHIGHLYAKLSAILDPHQQIDYPVIDSVPQCIIETIKKCLRYDCKSRPSVRELIQEYEKTENCKNSNTF